MFFDNVEKTMADPQYDEALFRQLLGKRKDKNGAVSLTDIHVVFWVVAYDVVQAAAEQNKFDEMEEVDDYVMEVIVPALAQTLQGEGWSIIEYASKN